MIIDCNSCRVRELACHDCVVSVLLSAEDDAVFLDGDQRIALGVLADSGLVPPLRLVAGGGSAAGERAGDARRAG